jgi:hypothetical protein
MSSQHGWFIEDDQQEVTIPSINKKILSTQNQKAQPYIISKPQKENVMNHPSGNGIYLTFNILLFTF